MGSRQHRRPLSGGAANIGHFVAACGLDLVRFAPGQRTDLVTAGYLQRAELDDRGLVPAQVLYVGVAQESRRCSGPASGATRRTPVSCLG